MSVQSWSHAAASAHDPSMRGRALRAGSRLLLAFVVLLALHVAITRDLYPLDDRMQGHVLGVPSGLLLRAGFMLVALAVMAVALRRPVLVSFEAPPLRWTLALAFVATGAIAILVLRGFPNSADEYHLLFQADTFRQLRLWQDPPPLPDFFFFMHIILRDGKWVSHFPPGWPSVLALWREVGLPTVLAGPAAATALLAMLAAFARRQADARLAFLAVLAVATTPFFLLNGASLFSHCFAALLLLAFWHFGERFRAEPSWQSAALAGLAIGMLGTTRYFTAAIGALPYLLVLLPHLTRRHLVRGLAAIATGGIFLAALLLYDRAITGHALTTVSGWAYPDLKLGLWAVNEFGTRSTPLDALRNVALQLLELMEFTSPLLPLAYAASLLYLIRSKRLRMVDTLPLWFVVGLFFYPEIGGNRYGPRYWFDAFPFAVVTVLRAGAIVCDCQNLRQRALLSTALLAHLAFAVASIPFACAYFRAVVDQRMALYDEVDARQLRNSLVLVAHTTGTLRPMNVWDLTRNGLAIDPAAPVLYALDDGRDLTPLLSAYPERDVWRWNGSGLICVERCR